MMICDGGIFMAIRRAVHLVIGQFLRQSRRQKDKTLWPIKVLDFKCTMFCKTDCPGALG